MTKRIGDYDLGSILGEGAFGIVRQATHRELKQIFAIKIIDKDKVKKEELIDSLKREIQILMMIDHPNVVKLIEVLASRTKIYLVLEWVRGGELFEKIKTMRYIDEHKMRIYFRQIVRALLYCQSKSIAHRDLKPENILITSEDKIKVSDFGLSSLYKDPNNVNNILYTTCGTINYLAPEVIQSTGYDGHKADIWSLGVILYFACAGYLPFEDDNVAHLLEKIVKAQCNPYPKNFSKNLKDLISSILVCNPYKRISLSKIIEHPWFIEDITKEEIELFNEDKLRFIQSSTVEKLSEQNYLSTKTVSWNTPFLSETIKIRKMGAIELLAYLSGKTIQKITNIKLQKEKEIHKNIHIQSFTSSQEPKEICLILNQAFESQKPTHSEQLLPDKGLVMLLQYKIQKEIVELTWELCELTDKQFLINVEQRSGNTVLFEQLYEEIYKRILLF